MFFVVCTYVFPHVHAVCTLCMGNFGKVYFTFPAFQFNLEPVEHQILIGLQCGNLEMETS